MDVRSGVDRTRLSYGGFWQRFGAYIIDGLIIDHPDLRDLHGASCSSPASTRKDGAEPSP